ncbi:tRNA pseudouridine(55) synthase TruB [Gemmatimonadota bacterium]
MSDLSGILLVDKPSGPTSHDLVAEARRSLNIRRVGHAGTLDPFASGLLLLLLGPSTRLAEYFLSLEKDYIAGAQLGTSTSTDDLEGEVTGRDDGWRELSRSGVEGALAAFRGSISQVPPSYSAKKVRGQPAHRRVRRGERVELAPVQVEIHEIQLAEFDPPSVSFSVRCSSGTYIRALARDLGESLGVGAHLTRLRRRGIGAFGLDGTLSMEEIRDPERVAGALLTPAAALSHLPALEVGSREAQRIVQGQFLPSDEGGVPEGTPVAILRGGELLAVGQREGNLLKPRKVLARG